MALAVLIRAAPNHMNEQRGLQPFRRIQKQRPLDSTQSVSRRRCRQGYADGDEVFSFSRRRELRAASIFHEAISVPGGRALRAGRAAVVVLIFNEPYERTRQVIDIYGRRSFSFQDRPRRLCPA